MFDAAGLPHADRLDFVPSSRRALALGEVARLAGRFDALHPALFRAYWVEGRDLGSDDVLRALADDAGLDADDALAGLDDPALLRVIADSTEGAMSAGAGGVPAWAIDERVLLPGAQPHEVFERVLDRLGHAPLGD